MALILRDPTAFFPHEWYTSDVYEQMEYSMLVRRQDWHAILDKAAKKGSDGYGERGGCEVGAMEDGGIE